MGCVFAKISLFFYFGYFLITNNIVIKQQLKNKFLALIKKRTSLCILYDGLCISLYF